MISIIACVDKEGGIGLNGDIPWSLPPDMKHFRSLTLNNVIIMGRKTWESIGSKPLPKRINIVITSKPELINGAFACKNIIDALTIANKHEKKIFFIGGHGIYKEALQYAATVYLTRIDRAFECDTMFPLDTMTGFRCIADEWQTHNDLSYRFETHKRVYSEFE